MKFETKTRKKKFKIKVKIERLTEQDELKQVWGDTVPTDTAKAGWIHEKPLNRCKRGSTWYFQKVRT